MRPALTRVLALDAALSGCSVALVEAGVVLAERAEDAARGQPGRLASMAAEVLGEALGEAGAFDLVAVTVGPGSFTGLRAAIALAHGLALGAGCPVVGVTVAEALAEAAGPCGARALWVALDNRRGRVFLDRDGVLAACALDALPRPDGPVAVAGDRDAEVTALLRALGCDAVATGVRQAHARHVAAVGGRRAAGVLAPLAAQPLYVDPPEARLPAGGLRPAPA